MSLLASSSDASSHLNHHQPSVVTLADPTPQPQHEEQVNNPP